MKKGIIILVFIPFIFSCNNSKKEAYTSKKKEEKVHLGKKLMETNCYVCHSPTASEEDRIGPPMVAIKKHYIDKNTTKEEFINALQSWIKNPNESDAKMFGAVKRFGVMPKTLYPEETIEKIADYIFDNDIEQPEWFESHMNKEDVKDQEKDNNNEIEISTDYEDLSYAERGLKYALATKEVLGKNLMGAIQKKGTVEALSFCNEKAYPLTDSMAVAQNATIKRVSDKPRNPNNQANDEELRYIETFKQVVANQQEPSPIVKESEDRVRVYYPILTNAMCLQCHGKPNQTIKKATFEKLTFLYPNDKAIDYDINEVRGVWSISFNK